MTGCIATIVHARNDHISTFTLKFDVTRPIFPLTRENSGHSAINKRYVAYLALRKETVRLLRGSVLATKLEEDILQLT